MCEAGQAPTVKQSDGSGTLTLTSMGTIRFCVTSYFNSVAKKTISNVNSLMVVFLFADNCCKYFFYNKTMYTPQKDKMP